MGPLKHIKTTVPSVKGDIAVELRNEPKAFTLNLVSPADTTAIVGIPKRAGATITRVTVNGQTVWENGNARGEVDGLAFLEDREHYLVFAAEPGGWSLTAESSQ